MNAGACANCAWSQQSAQCSFQTGCHLKSLANYMDTAKDSKTPQKAGKVTPKKTPKADQSATSQGQKRLANIIRSESPTSTSAKRLKTHSLITESLVNTPEPTNIPAPKVLRPTWIQPALQELVERLQQKGLHGISEAGTDELDDIEQVIQRLEEGRRYLDSQLARMKKEYDRIIQYGKKKKINDLTIDDFFKE